ncbi:MULTISPECIES: hypothetical protein [Bacillus cereus group]|uniref:hypothetical protein n=1 Tax=Bacillus cereus group TaxID=86661 RepID=UPI000BEBD77A|nr:MULTISPECIES: hypothetical protein [Bacillus cereus group]MBJ8112353.1 hypothetical protein [Bacillus cereus group sp. N6]PEF32612.1 hypothetical protein CON72_29925 [Bacillus wiedmannii]
MKLTKLEKAVMIGTFITALGKEELDFCTDEFSLEHLEVELEEILDDCTLKQIMAAGRSGMNKMIQELLEES